MQPDDIFQYTDTKIHYQPHIHDPQLALIRQHLECDPLDYARMIRLCVSDTEDYFRKKFSQLNKNEKTVIGTKFECELKYLFELPDGEHDTKVADIDLNVKHTCGTNWMVRKSTCEGLWLVLGKTNLLDDTCSLGLLFAASSTLSRGEGNGDNKLTVSYDGLRRVVWLVSQAPLLYNPTFRNKIGSL